MSDNVGQGINAPNAGWTFSGIAKDFDSHVHRSIPYYAESHDLVCKYSDFFVKDQSCVYDFGCSTGALLEKLLKKHGHRSGIRLVGIDTVSEMVEFAKKRTEGDNRCEYVCGDAALLELQPADMIISFYTAQFVAPRSRQRFFDVAYRTLNWGGAFFLFEKVRGPDARFQDYASQIYTDYKIDQGLNAEEIVNKTRSLKGVLEPFTSTANRDFLVRAGFTDISTIFRWVCFQGYLAIK